MLKNETGFGLLLCVALTCCGGSTDDAGGTTANDGGAAASQGGGAGTSVDGGGGAGAQASDATAGTGGDPFLPPPPGDSAPGPDFVPYDPMPRPAWTPEYLPLGQPGWRESKKPFCSDELARLTPRVWSTPASVYVLVNRECNGLQSGTTPCTAPGTAADLYANSGTGWSLVYSDASPDGSGIHTGGLTGFASGPLVLWGLHNGCGVTLVSQSGTGQCADPPGATALEVYDAAVGGDRLYVVVPDDPNGGPHVVVREYRAGNWTEVFSGDVVAPMLAASPTGDVLLAGVNYAALRRVGGAFAPLPSVPAGGYTSAWLFGAADVVLGNDIGHVVRFDGAQWTTIDTGLNTTLYDLWGASDGILYFRSGAQLGRLSGSKVDVFAAPPSGVQNYGFSDLWGNSSSEVFLTLNDTDYGLYECGVSFVVWFDGTEFHQF